MTDSIRIDTGEKRILVNEDPTRAIVFNPSDVGFAERFQKVYADLQAKVELLELRAKELDKEDGADGNGIPLNAKKRLEFLREACEYMRSEIDELFGAGTSQAAFGDALGLSMFEQFFRGITPYIKEARSKKTVKYLKQVNDNNLSNLRSRGKNKKK